jgi:hypothetical protein
MSSFTKGLVRGAPGLILTAGLALLLAAAPAEAQGSGAAEKPPTPDRPTMSKFGTDLGNREAGALLREMRQLVQETVATSRAAEQAATVADVKTAAAKVITTLWGIPVSANGDAVVQYDVPGWKEHWQVSGAEFDQAFVKRLGSLPPKITDPRKLGVEGRGMAVRGWLDPMVLDTVHGTAAERSARYGVFASLGNVTGWLHMSKGYKGKEIQPRASLTYMWDQPPAFWNSSADTGWLFEAYSQAGNILKTDYAGDVAEARKHAAGLTALLQRLITGVDADRNGTVDATVMEGGLDAAIAASGAAGLPTQ